MMSRFRTYLSVFILTTALVPSVGCGSSAGEIAEQQEDAPTEVEILYNSILAEYRRRGWEIGIASPQKLVVASVFMNVTPDVRRRYITRILVIPAGIALNITAEYQRGEPQPESGRVLWMLADDPTSKALARRDEADLNGAIQSQFKELSD